MKNIKASDKVKKTITFKGIPIDLEWLDGEVRTYPGSPYKNPLDGFGYGYVRNTDTPDGEELDVYVKTDPNSDAPVYLLNQLHHDNKDKDKEGKFDEHKYFLGFNSPEEVKEKYEKFLEPAMFGGSTEMSFDDFKNTHVKFYKKKVTSICQLGNREYTI